MKQDCVLCGKRKAKDKWTQRCGFCRQKGRHRLNQRTRQDILERAEKKIYTVWTSDSILSGKIHVPKELAGLKVKIKIVDVGGEVKE